MRCVQCQHENASDAKFCNQCAAPFAPVCSACGRENAADANFCNQCGIGLTSAPGVVHARQHEADAESRFQALLPAVSGLLHGQRRVTYRTLKYIFGLDEALLEDVKEELLFTGIACDEALI